MDNEAAQAHWEATMATQRALNDMSDNPRQIDPWQRPADQCRRAQSGHGDGFNAMTVPF
jgi:hypothetical protein